MRASLHTSNWLPYPELVEEQPGDAPYDIHDTHGEPGHISTGWVSISERIMGVPLSAEGAATMRHELAHVRWSPAKLPKVAFNSLILLSVEDARINLALRHAKLPVEHTAATLQKAVQLARRDLGGGDPAIFVLRAIAGVGADASNALIAAADGAQAETRALAERLVAEVGARLEKARLQTRRKTIASVRAGLGVARFVADALDNAGLRIREGSRAWYLSHGGCCTSGKELLRAGRVRLHGGALPRPRRRRASEMLIAEPRLTVPCPPPRTGLGERRAVREGAIVRYPGRWYGDRAIFAVRRRNRGGTVCIDTSSSMKLDAAGVDLIMKGAPAATLVAIYSGGERNGELRIVARNGQRVDIDQLRPYGPDNLVDLEALEWLAQQPGPRVWLSDGLVTGSRIGCAKLVGRKCRDVCRRHGIRRVMTAADAAAILEGRPVRPLPIIP